MVNMKFFKTAWESSRGWAVGSWTYLTQRITMRHLQGLAIITGLLTFYHVLVLCGVASYGGSLSTAESGIENAGIVSAIFNAPGKLYDRIFGVSTANGTDANETGTFLNRVVQGASEMLGTAFTFNKQHPPKKLPLKIILSPYFQHNQSLEYSKSIENVLVKLTKYPELTMQVNEVGPLRDWWFDAGGAARSTFRKLLAAGRIEILTGGWTPANEAVINLYSMIDQLIEQQHWVQTDLNVNLETSWLKNTYGHGPVFPYILTRFGINSTVITGKHGWEKFSSDKQNGDFVWSQRWNNESKRDSDVLVHHHPCKLDISMTESDPLICSVLPPIRISLESPLTELEIKKMADELIELARNRSSRSAHNVALITVQEDTLHFLKSTDGDLLVRIVDYVQNRSDEYKNLQLEFGTVKKYFQEIRKRQDVFPRVFGDLIPFSNASVGDATKLKGQGDSFSSRPFTKKLYRETESMLRDTEILFSFVNMATRQQQKSCFNRKDAVALYKDLQVARRGLSEFVEQDSRFRSPNSTKHLENRESKLNEALDKASEVQLAAANCLIFLSLYDIHPNFTANLSRTRNRPSAFELPKSIPITFEQLKLRRIVLFNSFGWRRGEFVSVQVQIPKDSNVWFLVTGPNGKYVQSQLIPVLEFEESSNTYEFSNSKFNLMFMAELDPLALSIFTVANYEEKVPYAAFRVNIRQFNLLSQPNLPIPTNDNKSDYDFDEPKEGEISIKNGRLKLLVNPKTGFTAMRTMIRSMDKRTWIDINLSLGSYVVDEKQSNGNILRPTTKEATTPFTDIPENIYLIRGTLTAELIIIKSHIIQTLRLLHTGSEWEEMENSVYIQNRVRGIRSPGEFFMRFDSNLESTKHKLEPPAFYTDQAGFSFEKRIALGHAGVPINTMGYLQDVQKGFRLSLLVDRAHGISSLRHGRLEVLIDQFVPNETSRETISNYIMLLEDVHAFPHKDTSASLNYRDTFPTLLSHHLSQTLSYPVPIFIATTELFKKEIDIAPEFSVVPLVNHDFPCNTHLVNFRTMFQTEPLPDLDLPSLSSLMILQNLGFSYDCEKFKPESCHWNERRLKYPHSLFHKDTAFTTRREDVQPILTDLTGLRKIMNTATDTKNSSSTEDGQEELQLKQRLEDLQSEPFELTSFLIDYEVGVTVTNADGSKRKKYN